MWVLVENPCYPGYFIYLEIGNSVTSHKGMLYEKINCFEKRQLNYSMNLCGVEDISSLIDFAKNIVFSKSINNNTHIQKVYVHNLYTHHTDGRTKWQVLNASLINDKQKKVMKELKHVEMISTEERWGIKLEDRKHTILRFISDNEYFDYDCNDAKIIHDGSIICQNLSDLENKYINKDLESTYQLSKAVLDDEFDLLKYDEKFRYQLLGKLQADCDYHLGNGNRCIDCLWAKNIEKQINAMRLLYTSFPDDKKPEWLTLEQINEYENKMFEKRKV